MSKATTLDEKTLKQWYESMQDIDEQIQELKNQKLDLIDRINAAKLIIGQTQHQGVITPSKAKPFSLNPHDPLPLSILKALKNIVQPIDKPFLFRELLNFGIPEKRLGVRKSYFYTALNRLEEEGLIMKSQDGKMSLSEKGKAKLKK